jgi:hypothetical protein
MPLAQVLSSDFCTELTKLTKLQTSWLQHLSTDHIENTVLLLLRACTRMLQALPSNAILLLLLQ